MMTSLRSRWRRREVIELDRSDSGSSGCSKDEWLSPHGPGWVKYLAVALLLVFLGELMTSRGVLLTRNWTHWERQRPLRNLYVIFDHRYGQLNNQLSSFANAAAIAKFIESKAAVRCILVVPTVEVGMESRFSTSKKNAASYTLFGDYFDFGAMNLTIPIISIDDFLETEEAQRAKQLELVSVPVNRKRIKPGNVVYEALNVSQLSAEDEDVMLTATSNLYDPRNCNVFVGLGMLSLRWIKNNPKSQVLALGQTYLANHQLDCLEEYPIMGEIFASLRPREAYTSSASISMASMKRPIVALHLRMLYKEEYFDRDVLIALFKAGLEEASMKAESVGTLYVAHGSRELEQIERSGCVDRFQEVYPHVAVRKCEDGFDCPAQGSTDMKIGRRSTATMELTDEEYAEIYRAGYSAAMIDMWTCAQSDLFMGRSSSTFSRNIAFMRRSSQHPQSVYYNGALEFHRSNG
mmetsp:Transcript_615/g.2068  ORF Transcript_615/g.2068 Transcript_615/m.2068 type:complete len:464 (-) Transcript_615:178-1569(-)